MIYTDLKKNFISSCAEGDISPDLIDLYVREWHEGTSSESLAEYLDMSDEEYASWVENPGVLKDIIASRKK